MLLFVDNLINVDFSYLDAERGLVGETWLASVELEGSLDDQGMVCDFGIVKKTIREWLDTQIDHRLLVPTESTALKTNKSAQQTQHLVWESAQGELELHSPAQALTLIPIENINTSEVANWCVSQLMPLFPGSVIKLKLRFLTENIDGPFYHYSHGLKKHAGNCQRIAHGHRSKIEIWINDKPAIEEAMLWAQTWRDIYVGSEEDIDQRDTTHIGFAYKARQGEFYLRLPQNTVYLIPTDSTVELIAAHIAQQLKNKYPQSNIRVKAYEGLAKGAIAFA